MRTFYRQIEIISGRANRTEPGTTLSLQPEIVHAPARLGLTAFYVHSRLRYQSSPVFYFAGPVTFVKVWHERGQQQADYMTAYEMGQEMRGN